MCVCVSVCELCGGLAIHSRHISSSPPDTAEDKQYGKWMDGWMAFFFNIMHTTPPPTQYKVKYITYIAANISGRESFAWESSY